AQAESAKLDSRSAARAREIFRCGAPTAAAPGRMICALKGGDLTSSLVALREAHGVGRARAWLDRRISPVSVGCGRGARAGSEACCCSAAGLLWRSPCWRLLGGWLNCQMTWQVWLLTGIFAPLGLLGHTRANSAMTVWWTGC